MLASLGVHGTVALMEFSLRTPASSMSTTLKGKFVVISLFSAEPVPPVSVHVGATCTRVRWSSGRPPKYSLRLIKTVRDSRVDVTSDALPPFATIHGQLS